MKSTGEAIGYDKKLHRAMYKAMIASGMRVQNYGTVVVTLADEDKEEALPLIRRFYNMGFNIEATIGTATFLKENGIRTKILHKLSEGSEEILDAIKTGYVEELQSVSTIADGIAVKKPGDLTYECCVKYVDDVITVSEDEIASAILALMESQKTVSEGAGATTVAAYMFKKVDTSLKTVCLVSGGNIDVTTLSRVINRGLIKSGRLANITTKVIDKPGQLTSLLQIVAATGANINEIDHKREDLSSEVNSCVVSMVLETRNEEHVAEIIAAIKGAGYTVLH